MMLVISWLFLLILSCISFLFAAHCRRLSANIATVVLVIHRHQPSNIQGTRPEDSMFFFFRKKWLYQWTRQRHATWSKCFVLSVHVHFRVLLQEVIFSYVCWIDSLLWGFLLQCDAVWCCYVAMPRLNGIKRWRSETSKSFETVPRPRGRWGNALAIPLVLITENLACCNCRLQLLLFSMFINILPNWKYLAVIESNQGQIEIYAATKLYWNQSHVANKTWLPTMANNLMAIGDWYDLVSELGEASFLQGIPGFTNATRKLTIRFCHNVGRCSIKVAHGRNVKCLNVMIAVSVGCTNLCLDGNPCKLMRTAARRSGGLCLAEWWFLQGARSTSEMDAWF